MPSHNVNDLAIYNPADYAADGFAQLLVHRYRTARNDTEQEDAEMALAELGLWTYLAWCPGCLRATFAPPPDDPLFGDAVDQFDCVVHGLDCDDPCTVVLHTARSR